MSGGWLRGVVKEVVSGDTVVISGVAKPGVIAPEKRITLSSLVAPRLGRRDGSTADEPFAWQAREFLRKRAIGQPCVFRVDYTIDAVAGREFGSVFVGESKDNLAVSVVEAGWAKVRQAGGQQSPFYEQLAAAEEQAKGSNMGVWTKDPDATASSVRPQVPADAVDSELLLAKHGKGKPLPAIVEQVLNGSTMRVTLLEDFTYTTVLTCGIVCPSMGRRPAPAAVASPAAAAAPAAGAAAPAPTTAAPGSMAAALAPAAAAAAGGEAQPEPFAREAKAFTEQRVLNREVRVVLQGVDEKFHQLFGEVKFSSGGADAAPADLGQELVKEGLAKTAEWSLAMMMTGAFTLREMERKAKQARVGQWLNYVPQASAGGSTTRSDKLSGTLSEVVSGDCVVVRDATTGKEHRLNLSSIRTPRMGRRDEKPEPWAAEAKELLRSRYIGKPAEVSIEYTRKPMTPAVAGGAGTPSGAPEMTFATVTCKDDNLALSLVSAGLAKTVQHRSDDARSAHYIELVEAEETAKKARKGLHSGREPVAVRINDVTLPGSGNRAKGLLPFLQRQGKLQGIVEHVMSGHRLKVFIPKESTTIAFSPSGMRAPQRSGMGGGYSSGAPSKAEPYGDEAFAYARELVLQKEVEIEVETVDKAGTFLGTLRVCGTKGPGGVPISMGAAMLEAGLAKLHPMFNAERTREGQALLAAQAKARAEKLRVWENDEGEEEAAAAAASNGAPTQAAERRAMSVVVTEVADGTSFFVQTAEEPRVSWLADQLAALALADDKAATGLKQGDLCLAQYSADGLWYRAVVDKVERGSSGTELNVTFVDFGNQERVPACNTRAADAQIRAVQPLAAPAGLAFLKVPGLDDDCGVDAANFLCDALGGGKTIAATLEGTEPLATKPRLASLPRSRQMLTMTLPGAGTTLNEEMLAEGLARLQEPKAQGGGSRPAELEALMGKLRNAQAAAKRKHLGLWQYGDVESDEEDAPPRAGGGRGRR